MRYVTIALGCAVLMAAGYGFNLYGKTVPVGDFVPLHLVLELSSIVVSFAVFAVGWYGYRQNHNARDLVIGATFAAAAAADFIHTMSYEGMPDFLGVNTPGRAAAYWLLARLTVGLGLLAACLIRPAVKRSRFFPTYVASVAVGVVAAAVAVFTIYGDPIGHSLYTQIGQPPTALKSTLEYVTILTYVVVFAAVSERRGWPADSVVALRGALIVATFAEVAFTRYLTPFGWMNMLGHIYKTAAYYLILNALFVTAVKKPYDELSHARDQLQALYVDAQGHRQEIEQSFARVGSALSSSLKPEEALDLIVELAANMHHVDCAVAIALNKTGDDVRIAAQRGWCHDSGRPSEVALLVGRQAVERGGTVTLNDLEGTGLIGCDYTDKSCLRSMACTPMFHDGAALGIVAIYSHSRGAFEDGDTSLLEGFASHAAVAVHNAFSYERESRIADVLQKSLLSIAGPRTDRYEFAQVYQPATDEALIGGDFYDLFEAPGGKVGLAIGDVSGKGLKAAVHTAMVKYSLRALATEGHSPGQIMRLLDEITGRYTGHDAFITMFFGLLDTETGQVVYASAGHEPAIYTYNGSGLTLPATGPVLGAGIDIDYQEGTLQIEKGGVLLLYTDGISEARRGMQFLGTDGISDNLKSCQDLSSENVARCIHRAAIEFAGGQLKDDAAILAVRALR